MMHLLRKYDVAPLRYAISHPNHAKGVYIINSKGIAYHQHEVLYIIKPQENARWRVMRYSPKGADDIHHASRGDDMPSLRLG